MQALWLIAGLGNPGLTYKGTRHNIGFLVVEELASRGGMTLRGRKREARYAWGRLNREEVILIKPLTFMNRSGLSVAAWLGALQLEPSHLIVIHDDLDLSPFHIRIRRDGGDGGHRGVSSISRELGSRDFLRIRVGIGRPPEGCPSSDYVLQPFSCGEKESLSGAVKRAADAAMAVMEEGLEAAMNRFNVRGQRRKSGGTGHGMAAASAEERSEQPGREVRDI
ncbi:MAG: aminoacyl-tRNA hydrolase [candidate division NC10 bacterium]|nr:aminoacyl-tRNA hydrolase [candidate division NC10 bacterium]